MPTDSVAAIRVRTDPDPAGRRILRLALGTAMSMLFCQAIGWDLSFMSVVFTLLILALPVPAPSLKGGVIFVVALVLPAVLGLGLLPFLLHARWVGILMLLLALYYSFYYVARGGSAVLGTFMTVGLTLTVTIGSVSIDAMIPLLKALALGASSGMVFVWLSHALLPDFNKPATPPKKPKPAPVDLSIARGRAMRSTWLTFPVAVLFLFMGGSASYTVVMIKVATMGQQANSEKSSELGRSLLLSTFWGGLGAALAWSLLRIWPSLVLYGLIIALAALIFGRRIFHGPGMQPDNSMWSYAFLTMIILIAPAVADSLVGSDLGSAFWTRLFLFVIIAIYGSVVVAVYDAFWPLKKSGSE